MTSILGFKAKKRSKRSCRDWLVAAVRRARIRAHVLLIRKRTAWRTKPLAAKHLDSVIKATSE